MSDLLNDVFQEVSPYHHLHSEHVTEYIGN